MKTAIKKLALCTLALFLLGGIKANAVTKTYDFVVADEGSQLAPTYGETVTTGGADLQLISTATNTFDNRIAVGPTNRNNGTSAGFIFRTAGDWRGLWSQYEDRNFSILNLVKGNRVTITISKDAETLKFVGGDAVVSGKTYTVEADGNLDFVTTGGVYIEKVVIEDPAASVLVSVGMEGHSDTYSLVQAAEGSIVLPTWGAELTSGGVALNLLATADNTFDNRIAVGPISRNNDSGNCFKFRTAGNYKGLWSQYADRNISILNLKKGEQVTFTISNGDATLKFVGGDAVVSGQTYTVEADGNLDFVTTGSVYIEDITISKAEQNIGGATLVSENALDFTNVDDIKAYVATDANAGSVTFKQVKKVPANTPLYLTAEAVISVEVPVLGSDAETITTNLLKGSATAATSLISTNDIKYYVFGVLKDEAGFYPVSTSNALTSAAGKAYLELTADQAASRISIKFDDDNETTGINFADMVPTTDDNACYTLQGIRVAQPIRGIYVRNGKKVFIK
ncbi:MAG: hypothetical protein IJ176_04260 [Prevotella sp.]|nr:hypothetical protein [Prevotella sp.]